MASSFQVLLQVCKSGGYKSVRINASGDSPLTPEGRCVYTDEWSRVLGDIRYGRPRNNNGRAGLVRWEEGAVRETHGSFVKGWNTDWKAGPFISLQTKQRSDDGVSRCRSSAVGAASTAWHSSCALGLLPRRWASSEQPGTGSLLDRLRW